MLPERRSAFLWGARQTGKSTFLKQHFPHAVWYDLLHSELHLRLEKNPEYFREEISALSLEQLACPIVIDEIQKIPALLDEVHWLIENKKAQFILCGSSARKLIRIGANLLGGRALRYQFYPLSFCEIPDFNLLHALQRGLIPPHYLSEHANLLLEGYVVDYLNFEIRQEGLVRNIPDFARFLDSAAFSNGEMVNFTNIARDCGVSAKTVESYYQILVDTLLGYFLLPFNKKNKRDIITKTPKFYFFDVGVANFLAKRMPLELRGEIAGRAFEHYILMELLAYQGLLKKQLTLSYWRSKTGLEVDYILSVGEKLIAIEAKISATVQQSELKGLIAFCEEHKPSKAMVVSNEPRARLLQINKTTEIYIYPWRQFLEMLWGNLL